MARSTRTPAPDAPVTDAPAPDAPAETPPVAETPAPKAPKTPPLSPEAAAWVAEHARPAVATCLCGCGGETKGRFVPGHDALLKRDLAVTAEHAETPETRELAKAALLTFGW